MHAHSRRARALRVLLPGALVLGALASGAAAQTQTITSPDGTSVLNFRIDPALGLVLESVGDAQDPFAMPFGAIGLWQLEFHRGPACILLGPENLSEADLRVDVLDHKVTVEWDDAESPLLSGETFDVEVEFERGASSGEFEGKFHVQTETPTSALHRVRFPRLEILVEGHAPSTRLTMPVGHGVLLVDPAHNVAVTGPAKLNAFLPPCDAVALVEPGNLSMQWWSFYDSSDPEEAQLFLGTQDPDGYRKEWLFEQVPPALGTNRWRQVLRHVPENNHLNDGEYSQPYPFVMGIVRGDWYDAARHYRAYALKQSWTAQGTIAQNPDFSDVMREAEMLGVTQPQFSVAADDPDTFCGIDPIYDHFLVWPAETQSQEEAFGVENIVPRIFFWDFNSFGGDIGNWFPARSQFVQAGQTLAAGGDDFGAYFVGTGYSTRLPSFFDSYVTDSVNGGTYGPLEPHGLVDQAGQRVFTIAQVCPIAPVQFPLLQVCQATQFAADYHAYVAEQLHEVAAASGMYIDLLSGSDVSLCYDPSHGHPLGGGAYYTQGIEHIFETVRQRLRVGGDAPEFFQQSEGAGERFVPWLEAVHPQLTWTRTQTFCDLFTGQCPRNGTHFLVVPAYGTVYHDFQLTSATFQLAAPSTFLSGLGIPILADPFAMRSVRNMWASHVRLGYTPFAGTLLSDELTNDNATSGQFPDYTRLVGFVKNVMSVLKVEAVRDFTTFGARLHDPVLTRANGTPLTAVPFDVAPIAHNWLGYGRFQPLVYGTVFGRGRGEGAAFGNEPNEEIGILAINWSDPSDNAFLLIPDGGPQAVRIAFDPEEYRPGAETYAIYLVGASGETLIDSGAISGTVETTLTVPSRSALFLRVELGVLAD